MGYVQKIAELYGLYIEITGQHFQYLLNTTRKNALVEYVDY